MSLENEQYPMATQEGTAIPLDIIKPSFLVYQSASPTAWTSLTIPAGMTLAMIKATEDSLVDLTGLAVSAPAVNTSYASMLFVPKGYVVSTTVAAGTIKVRAVATTCVVYVQGIQRWATLSLPRQGSRITARS